MLDIVSRGAIVRGANQCMHQGFPQFQIVCQLIIRSSWCHSEFLCCCRFRQVVYASVNLRGSRAGTRHFVNGSVSNLFVILYIVFITSIPNKHTGGVSSTVGDICSEYRAATFLQNTAILGHSQTRQ